MSDSIAVDLLPIELFQFGTVADLLVTELCQFLQLLTCWSLNCAGFVQMLVVELCQFSTAAYC